MISDNNIFQPFIVFGIILFIVAAAASMLFAQGSSSNYYSNEFLVSLNNEKARFIYKETFNNKVTKENHDVGENYQDTIITKGSNVLLNFKEYEIYDINNLRVNGTFYNKLSEERHEYKLVKNNIKIKIKKDNAVLYEGEYIEDLTSYFREAGRYYIHIYNTRKEHGNKIFTDLSMTLLYIDDEVNND